MLAELVHRPVNKGNVDTIINYVGDDQTLFDELIQHFVYGTKRVTQLTGWAVGYLGEKHPNLLASHHRLLLDQFKNHQLHDGIRRNIVKIYQSCSIGEQLEGELYDECLANILNPKEAIAIRAFSMMACEQIAKQYPDLVPELIDAIESVLSTGSAGTKNRGMHTIRRLQKLR